MTGFGPSSGRLEQVCEPPSTMLRMKVGSGPTTLGALVAATAFLGFIFGSTFYYEGHEVLGASVLLVTGIAIVLSVIWVIRSR